MNNVPVEPALVDALVKYDEAMTVLNADIHQHPRAIARLTNAIIAFKGQAGRPPISPEGFIVRMLEAENRPAVHPVPHGSD